tara:strand:+ start:1444 stop:1653 length:210 start_codon:yes stop_codon:yes gene_type:complete
MAMYDLAAIYFRLERNATVTPPEVLVLVRDLHTRIKELENAKQPQAGLEKPEAPRRGSSKVSKKKVPSD